MVSPTLDTETIAAQIAKARRVMMLSERELASRLSVNTDIVRSWESQTSTPKVSDLELLANVLGRSLDYFVKETPTGPTALQFRTHSQTSSAKELSVEARKVIASFDEICRHALEIEELLGITKVIAIRPFRDRTTPNEGATYVRELLGVREKPLKDLKEQLASLGIRIFELPVPGNEFSGLSYWSKDYGPCVLLSWNQRRGRKNFTLSHELFHLLSRHKANACLLELSQDAASEEHERVANLFAVELLLPALPLTEYYQQRNLGPTPIVKELARVSSAWHASIQATGYRLEQLGLMNNGHTDKLLADYSPKVYWKSGKARWEKQLGREYVEQVMAAYANGLISLGKASHCLSLPVRRTLQLMEEYSDI